ncbi:hypothetical protein CVT25_001515 [Psilocybe cyanescens]|uniref:Uncharacterized protein n=1 Tax=Psilocybe cyanescens TaxID=93625 RepID=A0A409WNK5_PSICY|nr:hypothetical protein CVT25_001515 [Psilocybe cyanescens]
MSSFRNHRVVIALLFLPITTVLFQSSSPTPEKHSRETIAQAQARGDAENTTPAMSSRFAALITGSPPEDSAVWKPLKPALVTSTNGSGHYTPTR